MVKLLEFIFMFLIEVLKFVINLLIFMSNYQLWEHLMVLVNLL